MYLPYLIVLQYYVRKHNTNSCRRQHYLAFISTLNNTNTHIYTYAHMNTIVFYFLYFLYFFPMYVSIVRYRHGCVCTMKTYMRRIHEYKSLVRRIVYPLLIVICLYYISICIFRLVFFIFSFIFSFMCYVMISVIFSFMCSCIFSLIFPVTISCMFSVSFSFTFSFIFSFIFPVYFPL